MTYSAINSVSYLKILKIEKRGGQEERCYSVVEESDMEKLKSAVKMEMIKNNVQSKVPLQSDNYQVEIDEEKQQMRIQKRGNGGLALKAKTQGVQRRQQTSNIQSIILNEQSKTQPTLSGEKEAGEYQSEYSSVIDATKSQKDRVTNTKMSEFGSKLTKNMEKEIQEQQNNVTTIPEYEKAYVVFSSKLVKFRESKLKAVKFSQSGSRGKLLITLDQRGNLRFHKIKGLKLIQQFDFVTRWENLDYQFTDQIETTRIELKYELNEQINRVSLRNLPL